jgi:hypothetical protein
MQTVFATVSWFRYDLKPESKAWKTIETVRRHHSFASQSSNTANIGIISQRDMCITQFGFMGFVVLFQDQLGIACSQQEMNDFCHFWRVLGNLLGIKDEFNLCCDSFEETKERLESVRTKFILPALTETSNDFDTMSKFCVSGLQCFNFIDLYKPTIFNLKRLIGVENYYYFQNEVPENFDRKKLKYLELSRYERFSLFMSIFIRQYLLKYFIIRWMHNIFIRINEFFMRHFPIIAIMRFGWRKAYVHY